MRVLAAFLLLCSSLMAQTITAKSETVVAGLKNVRQFGDYLIVDELSTYKLVPAATVTINSDAANITVKFTDRDRNPVPYIRVGDDGKKFLITTPGRVWIDVICIDIPKNIVQIDQATVTIGDAPTPVPPGPGPTPPGPTPTPVPPDNFNNIGQKTAEWTKGLSQNGVVGKLYLDSAKELLSNPKVTVNDQRTILVNALKGVPNYGTEYASFAANLNADISSRWPMSRGVLADYWTAVAAGLGVK